jgi:hypothetical protein
MFKNLFDRILQKYEFLKKDYEYIYSLYNKGFESINKESRKRLGDDLFFKHFTTQDNNEQENVDKPDSNKDKDSVLKKLYYKILFKTHPDFLDNNVNQKEYNNLSKKAIEAYKQEDWGELLTIAVYLDIDISFVPNSYIKNIEQNVNELEQSISSITQSLPYLWYIEEDSTEKDNILRKYIKMITGKDVKTESTKTLAYLPSANMFILGLGHPRTGTKFTKDFIQSLGLDIGHEKIGKNGYIDWSLTSGYSLFTDINIKNYNPDIILYTIRDPRQTIPSLVYTEDVYGINKFRDACIDFRKSKLNIKKKKNPINFAIYSIVMWEKMFRQNYYSNTNTYLFKIDNYTHYVELYNILKNKGFKVEWNKKTDEIIEEKSNKRNHPSFDQMIKELGRPNNWYKNEINKFAQRHGYGKVF